ncbi:MAG: hypothetical protein K6G30_08630 [Acetatifactor sp.]|nr:hypothetical protein [Acetatifactor sp.]
MNNIQITHCDGVKTVEINSIQFSGKRKIDWDSVEKYLKRYIGQHYQIDETDDMVYIGSDFPDEYANSKYSAKAFGTIGKAKANVAQAIPELIQTATNIIYRPNFDSKHNRDAANGWFRCTIRFTLPVMDDKGNTVGKNYFRGRMIIRCTFENRLYLYDIIDIKKEM